MATIAQLAAKRAKLQADLAAVDEEIAARAGEQEGGPPGLRRGKPAEDKTK